MIIFSNNICREELLAGKGMNGLEEKELEIIFKKLDGLKPIATKLGCTLAQMALAWVKLG